MRCVVIAGFVVSACAGCASEPPYTVSFTGDVQPDTELGTYKTGDDGLTVLAISGGRSIAINGVHVETPLIAVVDRDAHLVQLATVAGDPSINAGLRAQAVGRDATGGVVALWGVAGLAQTLAHYRADSLLQDWSIAGTGHDTVLTVSESGELAFIEHEYDQTGFHENAHLVSADGQPRWTRELPGYASCVWFAPPDSSARSEQLEEDVLVFAYSYGVVELAATDGSGVPTSGATACPAGGWYSGPIQGASLTLDP